MLIALASPPVATSIRDGLAHVRSHVSEASQRKARIVCFPEAYIPGLRGLGFAVPSFNPKEQQRVLTEVATLAQEFGIAIILGMEWISGSARQIAAVVYDQSGACLGVQTKNQLDPTEEFFYSPGTRRQMFQIDNLRFGIAICHEGFRYPETVRWAARRGAKVVFHPHCTGGDETGRIPLQFSSAEGAYYEKAMICRALENTVYFASVNYGFQYPESATALIAPSGVCDAHLPYGEPGVLVVGLDLDSATGLLATRYADDRYDNT